METSGNQQEREQLRKLEAYRKLFLRLWLKHWPISLLVFLLVGGMCAGAVAVKSYRSNERFVAQSKMFFYPRQSLKFRTVDIRQAQELFSRQTVLRQAQDRLGVAGGLPTQSEIAVEKNKPNLIIVTVAAGREDTAVNLVNSLTTVCMEEYATFRNRDLSSQMTTLLDRKKELEKAILACERKQQEMAAVSGALTPYQELERLRKVVSDELALLSDTNVQYANEDAKRKKLEEQLKDTSRKGLQYATQLQAFLNDQERLEREVMRLQQLYTDLNPKIRIVVSELEHSRKSYREFLEKNDISDFSPENLAMWDELEKALRATLEKLEFLYENREALNAEVARHQKAVAELTELMPAYNEAGIQRASLVEILHATEEAISELQLLVAAVPNDITLVERAADAESQPLFTKKSAALCVVLALWATGLAGIMLVWFEFAFGRVRNAAELACFSELKLLGSYPGYAEDSVSREHAAQKISHEFLAAAAGKRILFETALEGSSVSPEIREALEWAFRMNGTRFFRLRLGMSQEISSEETLLAAVQKFGDSGIMPVAQPGNLSPAEAELLKNDLRTLLESYDTVLINREDEAPSGADLLFRQTMEICDCALLYFGAGTTPRKLLRLAVKLQEKTGCATLAIMTGEKNRNTGEY